jgi:hypothetical protein
LMKPYAEAIEAWEVEPEVGNVGRPELEVSPARVGFCGVFMACLRRR